MEINTVNSLVNRNTLLRRIYIEKRQKPLLTHILRPSQASHTAVSVYLIVSLMITQNPYVQKKLRVQLSFCWHFTPNFYNIIKDMVLEPVLFA